MKEVLAESVGVILNNKKNKKFLLLKRKDTSLWEFPKGHMKKGEKRLETLRRELEEETGVKAFKIIKTVGDINFSVPKPDFIKKRLVHYYLAETEEVDISLSSEHTESLWVEKEKIKGYLKFDNIKELFEKI